MEDPCWNVLVNNSGCISSVECGKILTNFGINVYHSNADGLELFNLLKSSRYDAVLTDIFISGCDAIRIKAMCDDKITHSIRFYGLLHGINPTIEKLLIDSNFAYYFITPHSDFLIAKTIYEQLSINECGYTSSNDVEEMLVFMLRNLNLYADSLAYHYLKSAIKIYMTSDPSLSITKIIYPEVAKSFNTTSVLVEKTIRVAIDSAWQSGNPLYQIKYFGYNKNDEIKRPTNLKFIATMSENIVLNKRRQERIETFAF